MPRNKRGAVQIIGLMTTIIEFEKSTLSWKLREHTKNTTATSKASLASFVLGSQNWTIANDNVECSVEGEAYTKRLKLTGCQEQEFTCDDGQCIRGVKILMYQSGRRNGFFPYVEFAYGVLGISKCCTF